MVMIYDNFTAHGRLDFDTPLVFAAFWYFAKLSYRYRINIGPIYFCLLLRLLDYDVPLL